MPVKNVILINDYDYSQGGASKVAIDTANILANKGLNVVFFSVVHSNNSKFHPSVKNVSLNSSDALSYNNKIIGMIKGLKNRKCADALNELLNYYSIEDTVVHIHGWTKACTSIIFKILEKRKYTTILTLHEYFSICPNGALYDYKKEICCAIKCGSIQCLKTNCDSRNIIFKTYRFLRQHIYYHHMNFNYINCIYVSEFQKMIINKYKKIAALSEVITNPVDALDNLNVSEKEYDYIYIGRTTKEKGIDLFIKLANEWKDKKFIIVGTYNGHISDNLTVTGWVTEKKVVYYLKKAECLIFPSLWPETFGLNVIKALAYGIPCLVASNTAAVDYVNKDNGLIFEQGNYEDLKQKANLIKDLKPKAEFEMITSFMDYGDRILKFYNKALCKKENEISEKNNSFV